MEDTDFFDREFKPAANSMKHNPSLPKYKGAEFFVDLADLDFEWDPTLKK